MVDRKKDIKKADVGLIARYRRFLKEQPILFYKKMLMGYGMVMWFSFIILCVRIYYFDPLSIVIIVACIVVLYRLMMKLRYHIDDLMESKDVGVSKKASAIKEAN